MIIFRGVKIFESRRPVDKALLCHHTPLCYYHVEIGHEPIIDIKLILKVENLTKNRIRDAHITFFGLRNDYGQEILSIESSFDVRNSKDNDGNIVHEVHIPLILPKKKVEIIINYKVKLKIFEELGFEAKENEHYLKPMPLQQSDSEIIRKISQPLRKEGTVETVKEVVKWVRSNIKYDRVYDRLGAITTLRRRRGSCIEISDLTVSIFRSLGIPARIVRGYFIRDYHAWVEIFTNKGWIPVEPLAGLVGAIGIPWISIHAEKHPREKEVVVKNCKGCKLNWEILL